MHSRIGRWLQANLASRTTTPYCALLRLVLVRIASSGHAPVGRLHGNGRVGKVRVFGCCLFAVSPNAWFTMPASARRETFTELITDSLDRE